MTSADNARATTSQGILRGVVENGLEVYRGIPYGRTGGAAGRWLAPLAPTPWTGVRDAFEFGPSSIQRRRSRPDRPTPVGGEPYAMAQSEECLTLNVWTSGASQQSAPKPVMVWLHGGGFSSGSASSPVFSGQGLAGRGDTVFVSINHRLGALGFMCFDDGDANVGLLDIVAALQWIRENIAAFGGDSGRVMIFGESGGGQKVAALMEMPSADGLFHAAAIQSGAAFAFNGPGKAAELQSRIAKHLGLPADRREQFLAVPVDRLVDATLAASQEMRARAPGFPGAIMPVVDGSVLPNHPLAPGCLSLRSPVPLIVGYNKTEATYFHLLGFGPNDTEMSAAEMRRRLDPVLGPLASEIYDAFAAADSQATPWQQYVRIFTEFPSGLYARTVSRRRAEAGAARTFLYRFDWETSAMGPATQSPHMIEIPFTLNNIGLAERMVGSDPATFELAQKVASAWAAFAAEGSPSDAGLGIWPAFSPVDPMAMHIHEDSIAMPAPRTATETLLERAAGL